MIKFLLILLFSCSCTNYEVNPELEKFVINFKVEAKKHGHDLVIDDLIMDYDLFDSQALGSHRLRFSQNTISINTNNNCILDSDGLTMVIFHELGHAYLDSDHRSGYDKNYNQVSIMNDRVCCMDCKEMIERKTKEYYMRELFTN